MSKKLPAAPELVAAKKAAERERKAALRRLGKDNAAWWALARAIEHQLDDIVARIKGEQ